MSVINLKKGVNMEKLFIAGYLEGKSSISHRLVRSRKDNQYFRIMLYIRDEVAEDVVKSLKCGYIRGKHWQTRSIKEIISLFNRLEPYLPEESRLLTFKRQAEFYLTQRKQ